MKGHGFSILKFCKIHIRIKCIKITLLIHLISVLNYFLPTSSVWKKPGPHAITVPRTRIQFSLLEETAAADMDYAISLCKWDSDH